MNIYIYIYIYMYLYKKPVYNKFNRVSENRKRPKLQKKLLG